MEDLKVDVAVLKIEVQGLRDDLKELQTALDSLAIALSSIKTFFEQVKGAVKVIMILGSCAAFIIYSFEGLREAFHKLFS